MTPRTTLELIELAGAYLSRARLRMSEAGRSETAELLYRAGAFVAEAERVERKHAAQSVTGQHCAGQG